MRKPISETPTHSALPDCFIQCPPKLSIMSINVRTKYIAIQTIMHALHICKYTWIQLKKSDKKFTPWFHEFVKHSSLSALEDNSMRYCSVCIYYTRGRCESVRFEEGRRLLLIERRRLLLVFCFILLIFFLFVIPTGCLAPAGDWIADSPVLISCY